MKGYKNFSSHSSYLCETPLYLSFILLLMKAQLQNFGYFCFPSLWLDTLPVSDFIYLFVYLSQLVLSLFSTDSTALVVTGGNMQPI